MKAILGFVLLGVSLSASAEPVGDMLKMGAELEAKQRHAEAVEVYLKAESLRPQDAEILLRIAGQYSRQVVGESRSPENRQLAGKALEYSERAVKLDPTKAKAHLSLAIAYGKVAFLESPQLQIEMSRLIRDEAETAIRLDPRLDDAWYVLGRWNYELASLNPALKLVASAIYGKLPDASNERAAECFEKAMAIRPDRVTYHVELGRAYAALGQNAKALTELREGLSLPARDDEDRQSQDRARTALKALE